MASDLQREPLTRALLAQLRVAVGFPVGDGEKPATGGFSGQADAPGTTFKPYLVLDADTITQMTGSFGDPQGQVIAPYTLLGVAIRRDQADWICDKGRQALDALAHTYLELGEQKWRVQQVWTAAIGNPVASRSSMPPLWSQRDRLTVWLSKEDYA